jgi:hypothetical protein
MKGISIFVTTVALCAVIGWAPAALQAQVPALIPIQGTLVDADGQVVDGTRNLTFHIFDNDSAEGDALFSENHLDATVDNGYFTVFLGGGDGDGLDLNLFRENPDLWLQVIVDSSEVFSPLFRLGTVPFASYSENCGNADTLGSEGPQAFARVERSLGGLSCAEAGHVAQWDGSNWTCGLLSSVPSADFADDCGDADTLGGEAASAYARVNQSIGGLSCAESGHVAQWDGSGWVCGKVSADTTYTDGDARNAMGAIADNNPYHHNRYTDGEAVAAMGTKADGNPLHHDRYADAEAISAVTSSSEVETQVNIWAQNVCYDDESELLTTLDPYYTYTEGNGINIASNQISTDFAGSGGNYGSANTVARSDHTHDYNLYTDGEAVAAMGAKADGNPLHHDRYTDAEAISAVTSSSEVETQVNVWAQDVCYDDEGELLTTLDPYYTYTEGNGINIASNQISTDFAGSGGNYGSANTVARSDHTHDYAAGSTVFEDYATADAGQALQLSFSGGSHHGMCTVVCHTQGYLHRLLFHFSFGTSGGGQPGGDVLSVDGARPFGFCRHGDTDSIFIKSLQNDDCDSTSCSYSIVCFGYEVSSMNVTSSDWPSSGC